MPNSAQSIRIGVFLAVFAATGFAMKGVFIKLVYPYGVDAVTLVMLRLMFAIALLWMVRLWRLHASSDAPEAPIAPLDKAKLFGLGLLGYYLSSVLDFIGLETVSASLERLILCLYPTFTVLLVSWFSGKPIPPKIKRALPLTYLGNGVGISAGTHECPRRLGWHWFCGGQYFGFFAVYGVEPSGDRAGGFNALY
ncbi:DMT family transporter [Deefgea sp. CFH1-16]|uniref:DMT family transporter n=1 Tax=Deefgea sp. CFH1-16 TaxID=2675457 RepID=UPI0019402BC3|nr:DMT family transporter [Deefgea sp. CFH1-16]